jgi:hypothetical protein
MRKTSFKHVLLWCCTPLLFAACAESAEAETEESATSYTFSLAVTPVNNTQAPALQSFAHGVHGNQWLLFAGRTNEDTLNGGLHMINGKNSDYSVTSFPPPSFNTTFMVYDFAQDKIQAKVSIYDFWTYLEYAMGEEKDSERFTGYIPNIKAAISSLRASNPLVTQDGEFLYIVGGYGTDIDSTNSSNNYQTFNTVIKLHVPGMIKLLTMKQVDDWDNLFRFGSNDLLRSTGGELHKIDDVLYLCGGHNFGKYAGPNGQIYLTAVYPFTVSKVPNSLLGLNVNMMAPISDVAADSLGTNYADSHSIFRRRDGPMVPILVEDTTNGIQYNQGVGFYGGVFKYKALAAWNDAIYVTPTPGNTNKVLNTITHDSTYNQNNYNVYSCPDFAVVNAGSDGVVYLHTFLPGGIGDGQDDGNLSGFSNSYVETVLNTKTMLSTPNINASSIFPNTPYYFGAEAEFIPVSGDSVKYFSAASGTTPFIDAQASFANGVSALTVGYIYGGIVAMQKSPGKAKNHGYGPGYSGASNAIWKVVLKATPKS